MDESVKNGIADGAGEESAADAGRRTGGVADEQGGEGIADEAQASPGGIADEEPGAPEKNAEPEGQSGKKEPEDYELAASEDFPMPEENLKSFSAACREAGLTREQAERILGWHKGQYRETQEYVAQQEQRTLDGWNREILEDREFGGWNYKATVADARRALQAFDHDGELRAFLRESKYQFNPTVIRALARVGRAMGEHGFVAQQGAGREEKPLEERMYPNMKF